MHEALALLDAEGLPLDAMRLRAFPFPDEVYAFVQAHEAVFVVEQNRDAQLRTLLITEGDLDPARLIRILNYDGAPITARAITAKILAALNAARSEAAE
jgi:2-oxoglutarate ferredoxin oxidoreductase subunit alpha